MNVQFRLKWPLVSQHPSAVVTAFSQLPCSSAGSAFISSFAHAHSSPSLHVHIFHLAFSWCKHGHPSKCCWKLSVATLGCPGHGLMHCDSQNACGQWTWMQVLQTMMPHSAVIPNSCSVLSRNVNRGCVSCRQVWGVKWGVKPQPWGALIRGVKKVSSFGLLWVIAVVSNLERYLNKY